ncbi:MAG: TauD/TfdA family dioxygenase [Pseudomonadota bacterium]
MKVQKLTPAIGAELSDIGIDGAPDATTVNQIYDELIKHQVMFITGEHISPQMHLSLAEAFGELQPVNPLYPHHRTSNKIMILRSGANNPPDTGGWHTDITYQQNPPFACLLVAREVPDCGGDTLWLSLSNAWESLPAGIQSEIEELNAVHDMGDFRNNFTLKEPDATKLKEAHQQFGSAIHPLVKTHPVSGKRFLYINESFTQQIIGMRATQSRRLLEFLFRHIEQPENQVRYKWSNGTMAIWDNRCTSHYATTDYLPQSREMHRITVLNDLRAASRRSV